MDTPDLIEPVYRHIKKAINVWPCRANRASMIASDCERQLVYWRTKWSEALVHDVDLEFIFREGNHHEQIVLRDLAEAGIILIEQQTYLEDNKYQLTGHVDAVYALNGVAIPVEIKSMSEHIWRTVAKRGPVVYEWREVADAFDAKPWLRKYYGQLTVYMFCKNTDRAILILKNKSTGALAQVNLQLDYGYAEELLQRCERINAHVDAGTLPDRIDYDPDVCGKCPFLHLCLPDHAEGPPIKFVSNDKVATILDTRATSETASRAFSNADKYVKEWAWSQDAERLTCGAWLIEKKLSKKGRKSTTITKLEGAA
jgi:CRISPR/Cas system-associated exonuclease Cas4 (RecB family)